MWLLVFFLTPIVEMYLLIEVGGYIGAWPTIGLVMLTAVIGVGLLRVQGFATLTRGLGRLEGGELPAREVVEGVLLAVAGALLLTPGFVTDGFGFALLTPPFRAALAERLLARVQIRGAMGPGMNSGFGPEGGAGGGGFSPGGGSRQAPPGGVLEGEFERLDDAGDPGASTPRQPDQRP